SPPCRAPPAGRLTPAFSGATNGTQRTIRNLLRGLRCNALLDGGVERSCRHYFLRLAVVIEPNPLGGEPVKARRPHAAHAAEDAHFAPARVVGEDQNNIRSPLLSSARRRLHHSVGRSMLEP